jgi:SPP1 family predicted phage head-tail adaptor
MNIGSLKKIIEIQAPTKTSDGMGGFANTYSTLFDEFAAIWPVSAKEQMQAGQMTMAITHRIRMRYRRVFKPDWRIKYGNRYFSVGSIINPNEENKILELLCKETKA